MVVPAPVHVARAALVAPHIAELRVEHGLVPLLPGRRKIPGRAGEGAVADLLVVACPAPAGQITVPGVEVGLGVRPAAADRVVLHQPSGIERLGEAIISGDPALGGGKVPVARIHAADQAPRFVEQHPRKDGRMVVVAVDHAAESRVVLPKCRRVGRPPPVGHVGHDEHAKFVGPVELPRRLDLDVLAEPVEAELAGAEDFLLERAIGREGVETLRVIGLVEGELEICWLAVDGDDGRGSQVAGLGGRDS